MVTMNEIGTKTFLQTTEGGNSPMRRAERESMMKPLYCALGHPLQNI